ncbi:Flagellar hook-associated protein 2 C-terminus [Paenibacillus sp. 1_12]|uniref:flagellar filament capping protein FliD n=1 Tax=Paenibacillus sp. 1_12 TaxID=1566278 RepID=UPI0008E75225|nr:flagellar filament capping protein FliD [Paenibacillus sp. 1_12]SFM15295.1 Flagellar hook-associated protein 2 C-terminus [Paenibacillus sp. 1_12]
MISKISEVNRVYRTNEIWREEEHAWQEGGWQYRPLVSSKASAEVVFQRYAFGQHARATAMAVAGLLTTAEQLKQAGEAMLGSDSSLDRRAVEISNPSVLKAQVKKSAQIGSYVIQSKQIAKSQLNDGAILQSTTPTLMTAGSNQMKLITENQTASFSIYILATDTNQQALQKIRSAINSTKSDLHASIAWDDLKNTVQLRLNSLHTGSEYAFSIVDIYGNAVAISGITNVTQQAADAIYHINGSAEVVSASNQIDLDQGNVLITLQAASKEPVQVDIRPDRIGISQQVQALVNRYNSLHLMLTQSGGLLTSEASESVMSKLTSLPLEMIGIQLNADGSLKVDLSILEQQAQSRFDLLEFSLRGFGGLAAALNVAAKTLLDPPSFELLDQGQALFQSFNNYQVSQRDGAPVNTYLPLPLSGILMNNYI